MDSRLRGNDGRRNAGDRSAKVKRLVVTADDFGASIEVNTAVEQAHRHGILTGASLMIAGDAAADAVARARVMPTLGVGLHIVLVKGRLDRRDDAPKLIAMEVSAPDLSVGSDGPFVMSMPVQRCSTPTPAPR